MMTLQYIFEYKQFFSPYYLEKLWLLNYFLN